MKKNYKAVLYDNIALFFLIIIFYIITKVISANLKSILAITFLILLLIPNLLFFGFKKDKNYYLGYSVRTITTILMISGMVIYLLGLVLGFNKGVLSFNTFISIVIPEFILICLWEYYRYIVIGNSHVDIKWRFIFTLLLSTFSIVIQYNPNAIIDSYTMFVFICTIIFPTIALEFLCTFLCHNVGFRPSLLYKSVTTLYVYILPIVPNLGNYLFGVVGVFIPFITFYIINKNLIKDNKYKDKMINSSYRIITIPVIGFLLVLTILISGIFKYRLIAVASNSMKPIFYRGDGILLEKCHPDQLEVDDIMVFKHNNIIVVHRIVDISEKNDEYYFKTKGDANDNEDNFKVEEKDVIGKADFIVKYIGYPTIWVNEMFRKE